MVNKSMIVGLTGPTGSGKSTACLEMVLFGCAVIDCDVLAHRVLNENKDCQKELAEHFGQDILITEGKEKGKLDRKLLGSRAFGSKEDTAALNAITHPYIRSAMESEIHKLQEEGKQIIILDAPTLIESGTIALCDKVIVVTAPAEVRKARIIARDNLTTEAAESRMSAQNSDEFYTQYADYILDGTMDLHSLSEKVHHMIHDMKGEHHA